jgi:hypothetical protein
LTIIVAEAGYYAIFAWFLKKNKTNLGLTGIDGVSIWQVST